MILLFGSILLISLITVCGSFYARKTDRPDALIGLFVVFVVGSQIIASKIAVFDLGFYSFTAPAAVIIFAVTFLITDIVNEKFGRSETHRMIFIALLANITFVVFLQIANALPGAPFWHGEQEWSEVFGLVPRITLAGWVTFLVSENLDAYLFALLKRLTKGKHLWMRNIASSALSLSVDTILFIPLAFLGSGLPLLSLMLGQFVLKYLVALLNVPFMYLNRAVLGTKKAS